MSTETTERSIPCVDCDSTDDVREDGRLMLCHDCRSRKSWVKHPWLVLFFTFIFCVLLVALIVCALSFSDRLPAQ